MQRYIAMWSGPRNISTAMMRAWGNRPDTLVCDEPLYAHYLLATGHTEHPGYDDTIRCHETDWRKVAAWLTAPLPAGKTVFYQKHMAHHVLEGMQLDWIDRLTNCFLIREPREMLLSLIEFLPNPTTRETGLPQQIQLFERAHRTTGAPPAVIDAKDVLQHPEAMLRKLCERIELPFCDEMLSWPPGPRETDGAWAAHWYTKVYQTTSFAPYQPKCGTVPDRMVPVLRECQALYEQLSSHRIVPPAIGMSPFKADATARFV